MNSDCVGLSSVKSVPGLEETKKYTGTKEKELAYQKFVSPGDRFKHASTVVTGTVHRP